MRTYCLSCGRETTSLDGPLDVCPFCGAPGEASQVPAMMEELRQLGVLPDRKERKSGPPVQLIQHPSGYYEFITD